MFSCLPSPNAAKYAARMTVVSSDLGLLPGWKTGVPGNAGWHKQERSATRGATKTNAFFQALREAPRWPSAEWC